MRSAGVFPAKSAGREIKRHGVPTKRSPEIASRLPVEYTSRPSRYASKSSMIPGRKRTGSRYSPGGSRVRSQRNRLPCRPAGSAGSVIGAQSAESPVGIDQRKASVAARGESPKRNSQFESGTLPPFAGPPAELCAAAPSGTRNSHRNRRAVWRTRRRTERAAALSFSGKTCDLLADVAVRICRARPAVRHLRPGTGSLNPESLPGRLTAVNKCPPLPRFRFCATRRGRYTTVDRIARGNT